MPARAIRQPGRTGTPNMSQTSNSNPIEYHRRAGSIAQRQYRRASIALNIVREETDFPNLGRRLETQRRQFAHQARHHYGLAELLLGASPATDRRAA
jgi:hypothetical protein